MSGSVGWLRLDRERFAVVARHVNERMASLGLTQKQLAARASLSVGSVQKLQRGEVCDYDTVTLAKVATALGWSPIGIAQILAGMAPGTVADAPQTN